VREVDWSPVRQFYLEKYQRYQDSPLSLGWNSRESQELRYRIFLQIEQFTSKKIGPGASLLDLGCGLGHLADFLERKEIEVSYTGIDIIPEFIEAAKKRRPRHEFQCKDLLRERINKKFDFVFIAGSFNVQMGNNEQMARELLRISYGLCNCGVAISMLSSRHGCSDESLYCFDPEETHKFCRGLAREAILREDYLDTDFTIYLIR
jgi:SAM-dependent methyltransferase